MTVLEFLDSIENIFTYIGHSFMSREKNGDRLYNMNKKITKN